MWCVGRPDTRGGSWRFGPAAPERLPGGCLAILERKLLAAGVERHELDQVYADAKEEVEAAVQQAVKEPKPTVADVLRYTYAPSPVDVVYPEDYTGLPQ